MNLRRRRNDQPGSGSTFAALERRATFQQLLVYVLAGVVLVLCFAAFRLFLALDIIEQLSGQQTCSDRIEADYDEAIGRVVFAAITDDDALLDEAREPLRSALDRLERIDEICPPVTDQGDMQ